MEILRVVLAALATWRITQFVVMDDGPFDLMMTIRIKLGRYNFGLGNEPQTAIGRMLECSHCTGKWIAMLLALLVVFPTRVGDVVLCTAALAAAQSLLEGKRSCHDEAIRVRREMAKVRHGS